MKAQSRIRQTVVDRVDVCKKCGAIRVYGKTRWAMEKLLRKEAVG